MRTLLIGFGIVVAALAANTHPGSAQGYDNTWCISEGVHGGGSMDCSYSTFRQCLDSQRGNGGTCVQNPSIVWQGRGRPERRRQDFTQGRGY